jgi:gluconate 2-dehydrogenase gamma chain
MQIGRRELLGGAALSAIVLTSSASALARTVAGSLPWRPDAGAPPPPIAPVQPGLWSFFTPEEGAAVEALVDRLIPPDEKFAGGKDAGCAVFIDRQLAGPYGSARGLYMRPPFADGLPTQGPQSPLTPAMRYRQSLAALDTYCRDTYAGKSFAALTDAQKDDVITKLEKGPIHLEGVSAAAFFELLLRNTKEGFFADPVYGGNRDMVGWRMIGFPGARYDYRDWIDRHNEAYPRPPVGIRGRPQWSGA